VNFFRFKKNGSPQPSSPKPSVGFVKLPTVGRSVCAWRCVAPSTPNCIHTIRLEHLRAVSGEQYKPWRAFDEATHHLWVMYRLTPDSAHPIILVSQQFDLRLSPQREIWQSPDWVAFKIGVFLVESIFPTIPPDEWWLLRHSTNPKREKELEQSRAWFWAEAVDRRYKSLLEPELNG
jgi:hypothetical protein